MTSKEQLKAKDRVFDSKAFGDMVSKKRQWEELGMREAAKQIGTSAATLSRIEGGRLPDVVTFIKICAWLHIDMNYFVTIKH